VSVPAGRINAVTSTAAHRQRRFLLSLLTLLTLIAAIGFGPAADASASTPVAAETRVRAIHTPTPVLVAASDTASPASVGVSGLHLRQLVSATGVATNSGTTRVFRVEGPGNTRVGITPDGSVSIQGDKTLFLNFGDEARATQFLNQRLVNPNTPGVQIKTFDVPNSYVDQLRAQAVPESMASQFPGRPIQVDISKTADSFGLRPEQLEGLVCVIVPGSGQVVC